MSRAAGSRPALLALLPLAALVLVGIALNWPYSPTPPSAPDMSGALRLRLIRGVDDDQITQLRADYGLGWWEPRMMYDWYLLRSGLDPDAVQRLLRRDPRVATISFDSSARHAPSPSASADVMEQLQTAGMVPSECRTGTSVRVEPFWASWDEPLVAVELRGDCGGKYLALGLEVSGRTRVAAVTTIPMHEWLPPDPPGAVDGQPVRTHSLGWGRLDSAESGPLHPFRMLEVDGSDGYLMFRDGSLEPVDS